MARRGKTQDQDCARPGNCRSLVGKAVPRTIKGLVNASLLAFEFEDTFEVPSDSEIKKLKPGDFVKVARNSERFWLRVDGYVGRKWHGTVANKLGFNDDLKFGDSIYFAKKNIYDLRRVERN